MKSREKKEKRNRERIRNKKSGKKIMVKKSSKDQNSSSNISLLVLDV